MLSGARSFGAPILPLLSSRTFVPEAVISSHRAKKLWNGEFQATGVPGREEMT